MKIRSWLPKRAANAHKGNCGRVYILAGSKGMVGAGILSSWGAVKAGAGMVRLGTVKSQQIVAAKRAPLEVTTDGFPENKLGQIDGSKWRWIDSKIKKFQPNVIAFGPGLGVSASTRKLFSAVVGKRVGAMVLDADALNILATKRSRPFVPVNPVIITPHPGELGRLLGRSTKEIQSAREKFARVAAHKFRCICLLKGKNTVVTDGKMVWLNKTGNPSMASAGMGDVLTGVIAAFWGEMAIKNLQTGFRAAALGAFVHGLAGDLAAKKFGGLSVQASQVADWIPRAIQKIK